MKVSALFTGEKVSFCQRNYRPLNHLEEDVFLFASNLREALSAGFILDGNIFIDWHCCPHVSALFG